MIEKKYFFILLYCLFSASAYGEELTDYTWQQESASCLININCIPPDDNGAREKRKKCLQLSEHEEEKNNLIVIGDSCAVITNNTGDEASNTLSAVFASVKKSFTEIDPDLSLSEAVDIIAFYMQPIKITKNTPDIPQENSQTISGPVILIRLKDDVFFDFNSKKVPIIFDSRRVGT